MESIKNAVSDTIANITGSKVLFISTSSTNIDSIEAAYHVLAKAGYHITISTASDFASSSSISDLQDLLDARVPIFEIQHAQFDALIAFSGIKKDLNADELLQKFIDADKVLAFLGYSDVIESLHAAITGSATAPATMQETQDADVETEKKTPYVKNKRVTKAFKELSGAREQGSQTVRDGKLITGEPVAAKEVAELVIQALSGN